jgi:enoyl-CoA hydratase/carnithine racemase
MAQLKDYAGRFETISMLRERGVLELTFHTGDGPLQWGAQAHEEFPEAFQAIAADPDNLVVIMSGTGAEWSGPIATPASFPYNDVQGWESVRANGIRLIENFLAIPVPVISAVNGPARRHAEIPLLADIVLASEEAEFQDSAHVPNSLVPGDGIGIAMLGLLGANRGRYFILTGERIDAAGARTLGLVAEVHPREHLMPRARELAHSLAQKSPLLLRYTKLLLVNRLRKEFLDLLGYGLALEGLGVVDVTTRVATS